MKKIQITKTILCYEDPYVFLKKAEYTTKSGENRYWAYIERTNETKAAVVIPVIRKTNQIILIKQFRVPVNNYVIEFPAGLIDKEEPIEKAALRELKEETGYNGQVKQVSPLLLTSSGLSSEAIYLVWVDVEDKPGKTELEDTEEIETLLLPLTNAKIELEKLASQGYYIDSKVYAFLGFLNL